MKKLIALTVALAACSEPPTLSLGNVGNDEGTVVFMLTRSSASGMVPVDATHAIVRVWNPTSGFNLAEFVAVPEVDQSTRVTMQVPAGEGYSVGVLAVDGPVSPSTPAVLGAGITTGVDVDSGQQTEAMVSVDPLSLQLTEVPALLTPGELATIRGTIIGAPIAAERFGVTLCIRTEEFTTSVCSVASNPDGILTGQSFSVTFNAPTATADATAWFQFVFGVDGREGWQPWGNLAARLPLPSLVLGEALFSLPLQVSTDGMAELAN